MLTYQTPSWLTAFTVGCACHGTEPGVDARETGLSEGAFSIPASCLMLPRQTHTDHVELTDCVRPLPETDAVVTSQPGLCLGVKTADCIPILIYDRRERRVAAVHAGWRGTVKDIAGKTIRLMGSAGADLSAIIGPGISLQAFEVGDEVYEQFRQAHFPMQRIARRFPSADGERWHLDLWEANRWLLQEAGVTDIHLAAICTFASPHYYSARRDTIATGRNLNCIMIKQAGAC